MAKGVGVKEMIKSKAKGGRRKSKVGRWKAESYRLL